MGKKLDWLKAYWRTLLAAILGLLFALAFLDRGFAWPAFFALVLFLLLCFSDKTKKAAVAVLKCIESVSWSKKEGVRFGFDWSELEAIPDPDPDAEPQELSEETKQTVEEAEDYIRRGEFTPELIRRVAAAKWHEKEYEESAALFGFLTFLEPQNHVAWYNKGVTLGKLGRTKEALDAYEKAIQGNLDFADSWYNKGAVLSDLGRTKKALAAFNRVIELDPDDPSAWYNKGNALYELGRTEEALDAYEKAIQFKHDNADAWINKGTALIKLGRPKEALDAYEKAITFKPDYAEAWSNKGNSLYELGRAKDAHVAYQKAIELKPDLAGVWYNRARLRCCMNEPRETVLDDLRRAVELDPELRKDAREDEDFASLRDDPEFVELTREPDDEPPDESAHSSP